MDCISNLPDDIITNILSRLPTKYAVRTCVLNKAWENKWTSIAKIDIDVEGSQTLKFVEFMDNILFSARNVRCFRFVSDDDTSKEDAISRMRTWLSYAFRPKIERVIIDSYYPGMILPRRLMSCTSLRELDISMFCIWRTPINSCFPNLEKLSLSYVTIVNENSNSDTLRFHFPMLKSLVLNEGEWKNVKFVEICAPALVSFLSGDMFDAKNGFYTIKIIGASLQEFETYGRYLENFILTESTVSSAALKIEDEVAMDEGLRLRRFLKESSSLKSLELSCFLVQALAATKPGPPLSRFCNLESLNLFIDEDHSEGIEAVINGLFELLHSAPVLKFLSIAGISMLDIRNEENHVPGMMQPVPFCVVSHLEEVKIEHYSGGIYELQLSKYFLENGARLKKLDISCDNDVDKNDVRKELSIISKSSTALKIVVE